MANDGKQNEERRFQLLVDAVTDYVIVMLDLEGYITSWNSGAERIKGYRADEIIGRHFSCFFTPEDQAAGMPARVLRIAAEQGRHEIEGWRMRKDGGRFWALAVVDAVRDDEGQLIGFAKITRDITERRAAQEALLESERQFRLLVSGVVDYALFMLDANGVVTSWNTGAERIKGYAAEEIIGEHYSRFFTETDRSAGVPVRALATAREQGRVETEGWRVRKDGTMFWASVVMDAVYDEDRELIGFAKVTRDITERKQAQAELQAAQDRLAKAQKMEALGQLTGGVAHDFNNLLMIVSGQAQSLRAHIPGDLRVQRALDAIEQAVARGERLTRQLLTFSRRQRLNPQSIDLAERIQSVSEMLSSSLHGNVQLRLELPGGLWPVAVDIGEFELALVNIAVNARDAMPDGGVFTVDAENVTLKPGDRDLDLSGDFVALTFRDTGVGIPDDILPKVFDPFFTTKQVGKGTGLGLSQVHGLAHQSGGAVDVRTELGEGTSITIYLPRATRAPLALEAEPEAPEHGGGRILVVEDNPDVASVSAQLLEQLGYTVEIAVDADSALKAVEINEAYDLVLSDIVMAGSMDGIALARRLRESHARLPVLLVSGYSRAAEEAQGEFAILRKPYQIAELGRSVSRLIDQARGGMDETNLVRFPGRASPR